MTTAIFNCKACKVGKRIDYPERRRSHLGYGRYETTRFRLEGRREIHAWDEADCQKCQRRMNWGWLVGYKREEVPCDARCTSARGHNCECSCGGENHGSSWGGLGKPLSEVIKPPTTTEQKKLVLEAWDRLYGDEDKAKTREQLWAAEEVHRKAKSQL